MKGKTNNPNGRPKGVPNKVTKSVRAFIGEVIDKNRRQAFFVGFGIATDV